MNFPLARTVRKLKQAISRRLPQRRDDSGLTTLEWLLIVAAVAGMAALAVVLVTRVVSDTSDQIAGQSARRTAAELAAQEIQERWVEAIASIEVSANDANTEFNRKCDRLKLIYGDVEELDVTPNDGTIAAAADADNNAVSCGPWIQPAWSRNSGVLVT